MGRRNLFFCLLALTLIFSSVSVWAGGYGAIAYSAETNTWGYSYGYGSRDEAIASAEMRCGKPDCVWKTWFRNGCGSLAKGSNGILGWDGGYKTRSEAEDAATRACRRNGGENCEAICWACSHN